MSGTSLTHKIAAATPQMWHVVDAKGQVCVYCWHPRPGPHAGVVWDCECAGDGPVGGAHRKAAAGQAQGARSAMPLHLYDAVCCNGWASDGARRSWRWRTVTLPVPPVAALSPLAPMSLLSSPCAPVCYDSCVTACVRLPTLLCVRTRPPAQPIYVPHADVGDWVVVVNARHIALSGTKAKTKLYRWHTGHPGGLKTLTARQVGTGSCLEKSLWLWLGL